MEDEELSFRETSRRLALAFETEPQTIDYIGAMRGKVFLEIDGHYMHFEFDEFVRVCNSFRHDANA